MISSKKVPAQGTSFRRIGRLISSCRFFQRIIPFFLFFLIAFAFPLSTWAGCLNVTSPTTGDSWYTTQTYIIQWNTTSSKPTARIHLYKNGKQHVTITSTAPNSGSYTWAIPANTLTNKLDEGAHYYIEVATDDCYGDGEYFGLYFPSTTSPGTPTSFTATDQSSTSIDLSWNAVSGATDYDVYTCADGFIGNTAQPSYLVTGLIPQTSYSYKVRSNSAEGSSDFTACQTATTLSTDPDSYTLSGRTKKADGTPILNATVNFTGLSSVQSISNGVYSQTVPNGWSGQVCATRSGCNFSTCAVRLIFTTLTREM
ncbi:Fibronectin type III domain-containing protein [Candidatus Electrothrix marina]|uniref:Fibronectin type III domain-containing protein n=1 Tax=Candidatus Electrothrix marina TaxID=1859130 RepID=A0A444JGA0_9BACT|nr:Fibronectin type III domain-containing protein [Candidatus Electrothrix marina]